MSSKRSYGICKEEDFEDEMEDDHKVSRTYAKKLKIKKEDEEYVPSNSKKATPKISFHKIHHFVKREEDTIGNFEVKREAQNASDCCQKMDDRPATPKILTSFNKIYPLLKYKEAAIGSSGVKLEVQNASDCNQKINGKPSTPKILTSFNKNPLPNCKENTTGNSKVKLEDESVNDCYQKINCRPQKCRTKRNGRRRKCQKKNGRPKPRKCLSENAKCPSTAKVNHFKIGAILPTKENSVLEIHIEKLCLPEKTSEYQSVQFPTRKTYFKCENSNKVLEFYVPDISSYRGFDERVPLDISGRLDEETNKKESPSTPVQNKHFPEEPALKSSPKKHKKKNTKQVIQEEKNVDENGIKAVNGEITDWNNNQNKICERQATKDINPSYKNIVSALRSDSKNQIECHSINHDHDYYSIKEKCYRIIESEGKIDKVTSIVQISNLVPAQSNFPELLPTNFDEVTSSVQNSNQVPAQPNFPELLPTNFDEVSSSVQNSNQVPAQSNFPELLPTNFDEVTSIVHISNQIPAQPNFPEMLPTNVDSTDTEYVSIRNARKNPLVEIENLVPFATESNNSSIPEITSRDQKPLKLIEFLSCQLQKGNIYSWNGKGSNIVIKNCAEHFYDWVSKKSTITKNDHQPGEFYECILL
ncbi:hypothetical protein JTE90_000064 [Oedothorax gibbosus]|uniref:Uncharacterized protein n=1 Tax=Oedothorax gibbosus TaxID=931172 RepID=A0AAV6UFA7_9ARAC|nr:hypothetical protein JTE90_000064 [Oedothorax gibbosus]